MQRIVLPYRQTPFEAVSESPLDLQKARAGLRRGLSVGSLTSVVVVLVCIATASIVWVTYSSSHHRAEANRQVLDAVASADLLNLVPEFLADLNAGLNARRAALVMAQSEDQRVASTSLQLSLAISGISVTLVLLAGYATFRSIVRPLEKTRLA